MGAVSFTPLSTLAKHFPHTAKTNTTGDRGGPSRSSDGGLDTKVSAPSAPGSGTNTEQLFAGAQSQQVLLNLITDAGATARTARDLRGAIE